MFHVKQCNCLGLHRTGHPVYSGEQPASPLAVACPRPCLCGRRAFLCATVQVSSRVPGTRIRAGLTAIARACPPSSEPTFHVKQGPARQQHRRHIRTPVHELRALPAMLMKWATRTWAETFHVKHRSSAHAIY